ncbi:glycosyltransferase family 4 protein [Pseudomarimonas salicorniae]|uniref:Glycosyltransferase n=1 Tax=Pseudomarimonas salicorniae TaxID=2933270 RepID=A0ABT0GGW8_9GAMM|nr:glycosyltransferase family 4 protein [Lysobacter sp. CAU 1642]MCK7593779.1 glycosyltransferase [Lysobacter sp. CAU 1642]
MTVDAWLKRLESSGTWDPDWYRRSNPDCDRSGLPPGEHFLRVGMVLQRSPAADLAPPQIRAAATSLGLLDPPPAPCHPTLQPAPQETGRASGSLPRTGVFEREGQLPWLEARQTLLVCSHAAGNALFGGERSFLDVLDGLLANRYNLVVTVPAIGSADYLQALVERCSRLACFPYPWWRQDRPLDEVAVRRFEDLIERCGAVAVHANTIVLREPLVAARRRGVAAVIHAREIVSGDEVLAQTIGAAPASIVAEVLSLADRVVANSAATAACFGNAEHIEVVPNPVDLADLDLAAAPVGPVVRFALISSNLEKKGVYQLVELARLLEHLDDARFVLVGPPSEATRDILHGRLDRSLPANLEFRDYARSPREALGGVDVVLNLSSCQESFGRTLLEAMAASKPVIAYDHGALGELVEHGRTGFLEPPGDVTRVAWRVEQLCKDRSLLASMGSAGRDRAQRSYSLHAFARRLGAVYRGLVVYGPGQVSTGTLAAGERLKLVLPHSNNSQFPDPFFVGGRPRFARCSSVKFVGEDLLVATSLIGQRMYLARFDIATGRTRIEGCIVTRDSQGAVSTDLMDFDGVDRLVTSNCEHRSISLYRVTDRGIEFEKSIRLEDAQAGYCHGVKFVPGRTDLVAVACSTGGHCVFLLSIETGQTVFRHTEGEWKPKDVCFAAPGRMLVASMAEHIDTRPGCVNRSRLSLLAFEPGSDAGQVLDSVEVEDCQMDGCLHLAGRVLVANQARDQILIFELEGERLKAAGELGGFEFPHAVDVDASGRLLAVASYGDNSVTLLRLPAQEAQARA